MAMPHNLKTSNHAWQVLTPIEEGISLSESQYQREHTVVSTSPVSLAVCLSLLLSLSLTLPFSLSLFLPLSILLDSALPDIDPGEEEIIESGQAETSAEDISIKVTLNYN